MIHIWMIKIIVSSAKDNIVNWNEEKFDNIANTSHNSKTNGA